MFFFSFLYVYEDGTHENSVKVTVDDHNNPIETRFPDCKKVFWQCRQEKKKRTFYLCVCPLLNGGKCNKLFADYSQQLQTHSCESFKFSSSVNDNFSLLTNTTASPLREWNYLHYTAVFFANGNVPLSAANIHLRDLLTFVSNYAYKAGQKGEPKPTFSITAKKVKKNAGS